MRFLAPGWLVLAGVAAAVVLALHLLNRQRLRLMPFPTARFVPDAAVRAVSRTWQPTDITLLLLRLAMVLLIGAALARPTGAPNRRTVVVALADHSPAADSNSVGAAIARLSPDTVIAISSLSAGLMAARQTAMQWDGRADSAEIVVVSPLAAGMWDAATQRLREAWPGRIRLIRTDRRTDGRTGVEIAAVPDHPVRGALARLGVRTTGGPVRIIWPVASPGLRDTALGVYTAGAAMVARLPRLPEGQAAGRSDGRPIAWFVDGSPAVLEVERPGGCDRAVRFAPDAGDGLLRAAGLRFAERLAAPCGAGWTPDRYQPADSGQVAALAGTGSATAIRRLGSPNKPIALLPLVLALLALGGERVLRRRTR